MAVNFPVLMTVFWLCIKGSLFVENTNKGIQSQWCIMLPTYFQIVKEKKRFFLPFLQLFCKFEKERWKERERDRQAGRPGLGSPI